MKEESKTDNEDTNNQENARVKCRVERLVMYFLDAIHPVPKRYRNLGKGEQGIKSPEWTFCHRFVNGRAQFHSDFFLLPTITIRPWETTKMNPKRYGEGCFQSLNQLVFIWLAWEYSITITRLNYKYT